MSKLTFRPRALEITKPLPVYTNEELPDLPEYSAINRAVPQLPSGMDKKEECEHHLQRAIVTGLIIPTPEVICMEDGEAYDRLYPANYKPPRQLIHMQPFSMEEDVPDYDIDSEDEKWLSKQKLDITPLKFEEMMDRLEKNCAQNFASQNRKELLLKDDDEVSIAVFDYWLSKRLAKQPQPLVPCVRTEANYRVVGGSSGNVNSNNNPYLAFRRRTEKMQTRKNRKNDEMSYEKMVKLRRDLSRALQLLEMIKKRESAKKELIQLNIQLYEKRYEASDFSGALLSEVSSLRSARPAFAPIYSNQYPTGHNHNHNHHPPPWPLKPPKEDLTSGVRKEKRQYKKRKHKGSSLGGVSVGGGGGGGGSSGEEEVEGPPSPQLAFPFHRLAAASYHPATKGGGVAGWRWEGPEEGGAGEERYRYSLATTTPLPTSQPTCLRFVRRRLGRGGRVVLDRAGPSMDDFWSSLDFTIQDSARPSPLPCGRYFRPKTPPPTRPSPADPPSDELDSVMGGTLTLTVESLTDLDSTTLELDLGELFPDLEVLPPLDTSILPSSSSSSLPGSSRSAQGTSTSSMFRVDGLSSALSERLQPSFITPATSGSTAVSSPVLPSPARSISPSPLHNGPLLHNDYGGNNGGVWSGGGGGSSGFKWSSLGSSSASNSPVQLSSKLVSVTAPVTAPVSVTKTEGGEVQRRAGGGSSLVEQAVHSQHPMEVT